VNIGFLDGHANWISSEGLVNGIAEGDILGIYFWGPTADCGFYDWAPANVPTFH
jgi:hypothetical protein